MDNYTMLLPNYTIGAKCYDEICRFCAPYGKKAVIIGGHKALAAVERKKFAKLLKAVLWKS